MDSAGTVVEVNVSEKTLHVVDDAASIVTVAKRENGWNSCRRSELLNSLRWAHARKGQQTRTVCVKGSRVNDGNDLSFNRRNDVRTHSEMVNNRDGVAVVGDDDELSVHSDEADSVAEVEVDPTPVADMDYTRVLRKKFDWRERDPSGSLQGHRDEITLVFMRGAYKSILRFAPERGSCSCWLLLFPEEPPPSQVRSTCSRRMDRASH